MVQTFVDSNGQYVVRVVTTIVVSILFLDATKIQVLFVVSGLFHTPLVPLPGFAPGGGGPVGHPQSVAAAAAVIRSTTAAVAAAAAAQAVHQQQQVWSLTTFSLC